MRAFGTADHWRAGAGAPVLREGRGDYGVEWEDDDDFPAGQDFRAMRRSDAGGREHWTPVIDLIAREYAGDDLSVLEVSSFQLETVEEFRPQIAVVLNITPDHLDRHGSFENYAAVKARITERQAAEDFLVLNAEDKPTQMVA